MFSTYSDPRARDVLWILLIRHIREGSLIYRLLSKVARSQTSLLLLILVYKCVSECEEHCEFDTVGD